MMSVRYDYEAMPYRKRRSIKLRHDFCFLYRIVFSIMKFFPAYSQITVELKHMKAALGQDGEFMHLYV